MILSRRQLLAQGVAGAGAVLLADPIAGVLAPRARTSAGLRAAQTSPFEPFRVDLPIPPTLRPTRRGARTDVYSIVMRESEREILPGYRTPVLTYDGLFPGPTIRARAGRRVIIEQRNALGIETNVHLHGGRVPASSDGHPMDVIPPGASRRYLYPNRQDAATLWYHDHTHGRTAESVYRGLTAFYLLEDDLEQELDLPRGDRDLPLMLQDKSFNQDGSLRYGRDVHNGFRGDTLLVNGAVSPRLAVRRGRYRLRFLNAANARDLELELADGSPMVQIAGDGGLLPRPVRRRRILISPAERVEVLVDFSDHPPGAELVLRNRLGAGGVASVMRFDVTRARGHDAPLPRELREPEPLPRPSGRARVTLERVAVPQVEWRMNGRTFAMDRVDQRARLRTSEVWRFVNRSTLAHPMHLHGFFFRVLARDGRRPPAHERGLKDTVRVAPQESVAVLAHFDGYPGRYVYHCHILEHGDHGMMAQLEVVR